MKTFPERTHRRHAPTADDAPQYIGRSEALEGHTDHAHRMPHPFRARFEPDTISGEGRDNRSRFGGRRTGLDE